VAEEAVLVGGTRVVEYTPLLMGLVTIHAGGDFMGFLLPEPPLDDLDMHFFDPCVAGGAGGSHVLVVNAGSRVGMRKNVVRGVARRTNGRDTQAGPE